MSNGAVMIATNNRDPVHRFNGSSRSEYHKAYRARHREKARTYAASYRVIHAEKFFASQCKTLYGITYEQYQAMLAAQGGRCKICGTSKPGKRTVRFSVDHCHQNGAVRGLLCNNCNSALGFLGDNPEIFDRAARYLRESV